MNRSPVRAFLLIPLALVCFAFSPQARAVCQDACLTNTNTVQGEDALISLTTGIDNTAVGDHALFSNTKGSFNTAIGSQALYNNNPAGLGTGYLNTAVGNNALFSNTTGFGNTATGASALTSNTSGFLNTATGRQALLANTFGSGNTAVGNSALLSNSTGSDNTAIGSGALASNRTGSSNTATGVSALVDNKRSNNTANGFRALYDSRGSGNTAVGFSAGSNLTTGDNNIYISNMGVDPESNTIRIGSDTHTNTFIAGISGVTVPTGVAVIVDSSGHLGTTTSSARFKKNIQPMNKASEAILALKPVTFHYKQELDPEGISQFGLVAEDVEKVNPDLVARDEQGKPYTVRYEAVNAMLLNEFLKEHAKVEQLKRDFESKIAAQQKQIEALTAGLQKVSAQLELSKSAPQTIANNQ